MESGVHRADESSSDLEVVQYCGFTIRDDLLAVPILDVQEVIRPQMITRVPLSRAGVRGLINLRGQIVTSISLGPFLGLTKSDSNEFMNVIVRVGDSLIALLVDEIRDVISVSSKSFEPVPDTLRSPLRDYTFGVHKLEEGLLIALDLKRISQYFDGLPEQ